MRSAEKLNLSVAFFVLTILVGCGGVPAYPQPPVEEEEVAFQQPQFESETESTRACGSSREPTVEDRVVDRGMLRADETELH